MAINIIEPGAARRRKGRPRADRLTGGALIPAAAHAPERLSEAEHDLNAEAVDSFSRAVGGRAKLTAVLAVGATDQDRIVDLLLDPRYEGWSLKRLCRMAGVTVADLFTTYKKALITRAHIKATYHIAKKLPAIVEDVMDRALPTVKKCPDCKADPELMPLCETCEGRGTEEIEPDFQRQKLALELGQLMPKGGGGIFIQQNAQVAASALSASGPGALEQLQQAVGDLLFRNEEAPMPISEPPSIERERREPDAPDDDVINPPDPDTDDDTDDTDDADDVDDDDEQELPPDPTG